jgi:hypothetical protein
MVDMHSSATRAPHRKCCTSLREGIFIVVFLLSVVAAVVAVAVAVVRCRCGDRDCMDSLAATELV